MVCWAHFVLLSRYTSSVISFNNGLRKPLIRWCHNLDIRTWTQKIVEIFAKVIPVDIRNQKTGEQTKYNELPSSSSFQIKTQWPYSIQTWYLRNKITSRIGTAINNTIHWLTFWSEIFLRFTFAGHLAIRLAIDLQRHPLIYSHLGDSFENECTRLSTNSNV